MIASPAVLHNTTTQLTNIAGKLIQQKQLSSYVIAILINTIPTGVYLLHFKKDIPLNL